jgi:hypothetical protein
MCVPEPVPENQCRKASIRPLLKVDRSLDLLENGSGIVLRTSVPHLKRMLSGCFFDGPSGPGPLCGTYREIRLWPRFTGRCHLPELPFLGQVLMNLSAQRNERIGLNSSTEERPPQVPHNLHTLQSSAALKLSDVRQTSPLTVSRDCNSARGDTRSRSLLCSCAYSVRGQARRRASAFGTFIEGSIHVLAAGFGLSAALAASATAFSVVKYAGALYPVWLGIRMIRTRNMPMDQPAETGTSGLSQRFCYD